MQIELSNVISSLALIVSIASFIHSRKLNELSYINNYRSYLSQSHDTYRKELQDVRKKHKKEIRELSQLAEKALTNIVHAFDEYDSDRNAVRPLRHLIHESSEMVFYTFNGQLGWQTAQNLSHRMAQISFIEDNLNPKKDFFGERSFRQSVQEKYNADPNLYLESKLQNDIYFCNLVTELKSRIEQPRVGELASRLQNELDEFSKKLKELQPSFTQSSEYLEELMSEGRKRNFQLEESHVLYNEMSRRKNILSILGYFHLPELNSSISGKYYYQTSRSIHACAILHMVIGVHSWGWEFEE